MGIDMHFLDDRRRDVEKLNAKLNVAPSTSSMSTVPRTFATLHVSRRYRAPTAAKVKGFGRWPLARGGEGMVRPAFESLPRRQPAFRKRPNIKRNAPNGHRALEHVHGRSPAPFLGRRRSGYSRSSVLRTLMPNSAVVGDFSRRGRRIASRQPDVLSREGNIFGAQNSFRHSEADQTVARGLASSARRTRPRTRRGAATADRDRRRTRSHQPFGSATTTT